MPTSLHAASSDHRERFAREAVRHVARLRDLFNDLIRRLPAPVTTSGELQRVTGMDRKICWKVFRVITAPDNLAAAQYIPGPSNMRTFAQAMADTGAPKELIAGLLEAGDEFEHFIAEHAGDRRTFDSMVSGFAGSENKEKAALRQRRDGFKAYSHVWGVQADASTLTVIQRPGAEDPTKLDLIVLSGEYGMRRLRPTPVPLYEQAYSVRDKEGRDYSGGCRKALSGDEEGIDLIPEFCSQPLPPVAIRQRADGQSHVSVMHTELGSKAAIDLVMGFTLDNTSQRYRGGHSGETHDWAVVHLPKPFRTVIIDLMVEEGTWPQPPSPLGFTSLKNPAMGVPPEELWTTAQLSDGEVVRYLGRGPAMLKTAGIPRYDELVAWAITRAGWDPNRFETWRLRVDYPVVLSSVGLVYELPEAPGELGNATG